MHFAGSVLWTLTSESFFICHCLIPWHYDYCSFICDKTLQQVRQYIRNSRLQQSAAQDRGLMGFMMFTHTLFISIFSLLFTNCFICVIPCPIWSEGSERSSFLISCFSLNSEALFLIRKLRLWGGVSNGLGCTWLQRGYVLQQCYRQTSAC